MHTLGRSQRTQRTRRGTQGWKSQRTQRAQRGEQQAPLRGDGRGTVPVGRSAPPGPSAFLPTLVRRPLGGRWHVADVPRVQGELPPAGVQGAAPLAPPLPLFPFLFSFVSFVSFVISISVSLCVSSVASVISPASSFLCVLCVLCDFQNPGSPACVSTPSICTKSAKSAVSFAAGAFCDFNLRVPLRVLCGLCDLPCVVQAFVSVVSFVIFQGDLQAKCARDLG